MSAARVLLAVALVAGGAWAVHRFGGARDERRAAVTAEADGVAHAPRAPSPPGEAYEARVRFVEAIGEAARVDVPSAAAAEAALHASATGGEGASPLAVVVDGREAILAPPPAHLAFTVSVPRSARLSFAFTVAEPFREDVVAHVLVREAGPTGAEREACTAKAIAGEGHAWRETTCDLGAWAGRDVTVTFATEIVRPPPPPSPPAGTASPGAAGSAHKKPRRAISPPAGPEVALALFGNPTLFGEAPPRAPWNVVWIVAPPPSPAAASVALAPRGVTFTRAYASGATRRTGVLSMLGGARASELGADRSSLVTRTARRAGLVTRAIVASAADADVDAELGFDRVDHKRPGDARAVTADATAFVRSHRDERFFLVCDYGAAGSAEATTSVLAAIDDAGLRATTLVVATADHGDGLLDASRVPLVAALPGSLPEGRTVAAKVRVVDLAPTVLDVEGLAPDDRMSGRSLLGLARGAVEPDARVVLTEGRGSEGLVAGRYGLVVHDGATEGGRARGPDELYDLDADPAARSDVAAAHPDVVADMRARLVAARANAPVADAHAALAPAPAQRVHLRFAGGGAVHRVSGAILVPAGAALAFEPIDAPREAFSLAGPNRLDVALTTAKNGVVGVDVHVEPPNAPVTWELYVDDAPLAKERVFAGAFGLAAPELVRGLAAPEARARALARRPPEIDAARELGLFVTLDRPAGAPSALASHATAETKDGPR